MIHGYQQRSKPLRTALYSAASAVLVCATPATAQDENFERTVIIMRACAQIADVAARVTCYDNTMAPQAGQLPPAPAQTPAAAPPRGLGAEQVAPPRQQARQQARERQADNLVAQVTSVVTVRPGVFTLSLADGSQWTVVDEAPFGYAEPRAGSSVRIEPGSLGSYLLRYDSQQSLRVRRVR
jgi:hypothetical protein